MKFKLGDQVLITAGKDKGKKGEIVKVLPKKNQVVVEGMNLYTRHQPAMPALGKPGEKITRERPLDTAKIAIINDQGEPDRIGYKINKDGSKVRIFKKTGEVIDSPAVEK